MNDYEIISVLGEGGSSVVYLVQQNETGNKYVMKRFFHSIASDEWKREVSILERLHHPQIPNYIDNFFHKVEGRTLPHLVMEHIAGENLATLLPTLLEKPFHISNILRSILEILAYTHTLSPPLIHRDIKPGNIVIGDDGGVYLIDFGVATEEKQYTVDHSIMTGTFGFQAPEQVVGNPTVKSDIYSVGILCVYLFTGIAPYKMMTMNNYLLNWRENCIPSIGKTSQSDSWWMWLEGMLEEDVDKRFDHKRAIQYLPKIIASEGSNKGYESTNPFLQKLKEVREEKLHQKSLQKEREKEEERKLGLESEKAEVLRLRIKQKKKEYLDELRFAWREMIHSVESGTLDRNDAIQLFWHSYKNIRFVEVDGEQYSINHPVFDLVQHMIKIQIPKRESFLDKIKKYFAMDDPSYHTLSIDFKVYWLFVENIFDVSETHSIYERLRTEYIQYTIELEFMDPYIKRFGKEAKVLEAKISELERGIALKQKTFYELHNAMRPYFFFTDNFETYKETYFDNVIQKQNQKWEISFIEEMSGERKSKHQNANDFRQFAITRHAIKIQRKYTLYIATPVIILVLTFFSLFS